jgi:LysM repeat protein
MTRETKIGLLVGLCFIIVFGLILGERTETPIDSGQTVAEIPNTYPNESATMRPLIAEEGRVRRGGTIPTIPGVVQRQPPAPPIVDPSMVLPHVDDTLPSREESAVMPPPVPAVPMRPYVVQNGDSLYAIARKVYGAEHTNEYKRIYEANRDILRNESSLAIGQTLKIPPLPQEAVAPVPVAGGTPEMDAAQLRQYVNSQMPTPAPAGRSYTVERGDTLTRVARRLLGDDSPASVRKLFEANREQLRTPDQLKVGMTLNVPR